MESSIQVESRPTIVVLTPVRNEAWILPRFLATTSQWADLIVVLDQNSTDGSREICQQFEKVVLLDNRDEKYDEAWRQRVLIEKARELVPGPRLLFAFDADEILAADAPCTRDWATMLSAAPGTLFRFEKPDLYPAPSGCVRWPDIRPALAYMDDNREHTGRVIHSKRLPVPPEENQIVLDGIRVLHYAFTRPRASRAKWRLYSVIENISGNSPVHRRLCFYAKGQEKLDDQRVEKTPPEWFEGWEELGIDMRTIDEPEFPWQDFEVLTQFAKHGVRRFWIEDIWDQDWENVRRKAIEAGIPGMPDLKIQPAPWWMAAARLVIKHSTLASRRLRSLVGVRGEK